MSGQESSGGEKTLDPTQKKLDDARKKGDIAKSQDISVTASYLGLALAFGIAGPMIISQIGQSLAQLLGQADILSHNILASGGGEIVQQLFANTALTIAPIFAIPILIVIASIAAQKSLIFAPEKIQPKLSRISPMSVAKNKFGPSGLFEFGKSFVKLLVISVIVGFFIRQNAEAVLGSIFAHSNTVSMILSTYVVRLLWLVFAVSLVISIVDYFWQAFDHKRKLMMSRQEVVDENKDANGDPHLKQQRRQRGHDIATQRMMVDIPTADVVIVNPEHYAVVLKWSRKSDAAPECVAKGVDEIAARIREIAAESGVPIHRDPPTARALFASVDIGMEIQPDHYQAAAAAIRFAEKMRDLARKRGSK